MSNSATVSALHPPGQQLSQHRGKFGAGGWAWYMGGILMLAGVLGLGKNISAIFAGNMDALVTALGCFAVGAVVLIIPMARWRQTVTCTENGIVWKRLRGVKVIRRTDVSHVQLIMHRGKYTNHDEIEITTLHGPVSIIGVTDPEQLVNHLAAWARGAGAPPATNAFAPNHNGGGWTPPA